MSTVIILDLTVGTTLPVADATTIVQTARDAGVSAIRLRDGEPREVLDPSVTAALLAPRFPDLHWLVDAPTTANAPYNLARRVLSLGRATAGRAGLVLRTGDGDEVSNAVVPDVSATSRPARWAEYAQVLSGLWDSFPAAALLGDQQAGVFADDTLITPIDHQGRFYRVTGPLDGPSSPQGRPALIADARDDLDWAQVRASADAVLVPQSRVVEVSRWIAAAAGPTVPLIGQVDVSASTRQAEQVADRLTEWAAVEGLAGLALNPVGSAGEIARWLRDFVPHVRPESRATLRATLGSAELAGSAR